MGSQLQSLLGLIEGQRLPSPLIIEGADRHVWAMTLVSHLLCLKKTACGDCTGCKKYRSQFHPDWIRLPEDYKIDDIRDALRQLRLRPFETDHRILVVPDLDSNQLQIQNSLLKTLEEPSPTWILILPIASRWNLLETLRSRCLFVSTGQTHPPTLSESDEIIFDLISRADDLHLATALEPSLKDRKKSIDLWGRLLEYASTRAYPQHWMNLAPALEEGMSDLKRNLNPKIVWDRVWAESLIQHS